MNSIWFIVSLNVTSGSCLKGFYNSEVSAMKIWLICDFNVNSLLLYTVAARSVLNTHYVRYNNLEVGNISVLLEARVVWGQAVPCHHSRHSVLQTCFGSNIENCVHCLHSMYEAKLDIHTYLVSYITHVCIWMTKVIKDFFLDKLLSIQPRTVFLDITFYPFCKLKYFTP